YYEVYIDAPKDEKLDFHSPYYVGSLSFFALKPHFMAGHRLSPKSNAFLEYDIFNQIRNISARGAWDPEEVLWTFVPLGLVKHNGEQLPLPTGPTGTLGRVTLATQSNGSS